MKCLFDKDRECPLPVKPEIPVEAMGCFCQACVGRDEMVKALESMKVMRAQLI